MGDWNRTTRQLTPAEMRPEMAAALLEHSEHFGLELALDQCRMCVETVSDKKKRGLFGGGGDRQTIQVAIITPPWLAVVVRGDKPDSAGAMTLELAQARVSDYADEPTYRLVPDSGVNVEGPFTGRIGMHDSLNTSIFIGLGDELSADMFRETLSQAVQSARGQSSRA